MPTEARETIVTPGALALPGVGEPGRTSGGFKVSLGEDALAWSEDSPILAFLLDGMETLQAIRMAGTPTTGEPTGLITIESITITEGTEARSVEG